MSQNVEDVSTHSNPDRPDRRLDFVVWWVVYNTWGGAAGEFTVSIVDQIRNQPGGDRFTLEDWVVRQVAFLFVLTLAQWVVLRRYLGMSAWWVLISTIGGGIVLPIVATTVELRLGIPAEIFGIAYGTVLGVLQWPLLRQHVYQAVWWILASTVGVLADFIIFSSAIVPQGAVGRVLSTALTWGVYGIITGFMLFFSRQRQND
jgi:hypothetical protein